MVGMIDVGQLSQVESLVNSLKEYSQQLANTNSILKNSLNKINAAFESTGQDKASYIEGLEKEHRNIYNLINGLTRYSNALATHIEDLKNTQNKQVNY